MKIEQYLQAVPRNAVCESTVDPRKSGWALAERIDDDDFGVQDRGRGSCLNRGVRGAGIKEPRPDLAVVEKVATALKRPRRAHAVRIG